MPDQPGVTWVIVHLRRDRRGEVDVVGVYAYPERMPDGGIGVDRASKKAEEIQTSPTFDDSTDEVIVKRLKGPSGIAEPHKFTKAMLDEWPRPGGDPESEEKQG